MSNRLDELDRCDREIAAIESAPDVPAWAATMTVADWQRERRLIEAEAEATA